MNEDIDLLSDSDTEVIEKKVEKCDNDKKEESKKSSKPSSKTESTKFDNSENIVLESVSTTDSSPIHKRSKEVVKCSLCNEEMADLYLKQHIENEHVNKKK